MGYDWDIDGNVPMMQGVYLNIEWEYMGISARNILGMWR
jgi:hypothetical protein